MAEPKTRVVIVDGGTVGWMAAAALSRVLPGRCSERVIESETIGVVGVGGATLPHIRVFDERLGIDETDFMACTRATFELGIELGDWNRIGDRWIHPSGPFGRGTGGVDFQRYRPRLLRKGVAMPSLGSVSYAWALARAGKFDRPESDPHRLPGTVGYAYQFDVSLFAPYPLEITQDMGARRTEGGVAMPCRTRTAVTSYTTAIAHPAAWRWTGGAQSGVASASGAISDAKAARVLHNAAGPTPGAPIRIRPATRPNHGGAIGSQSATPRPRSSPLAGCDLHLALSAIDRLIAMLPGRVPTHGEAAEHNRQTLTEAERIGDFLALHYTTARRDDPLRQGGAAALPHIPTHAAHRASQTRHLLP